MHCLCPARDGVRVRVAILDFGARSTFLRAQVAKDAIDLTRKDGIVDASGPEHRVPDPCNIPAVWIAVIRKV